MYQLTWKKPDAWRKTVGAATIPQPPAERGVRSIARLVWEEHCVECVVPQCYTSCKLYAPRADQKCARFAYGIMPNSAVGGPFGYGADIEFRRWAKLEAEIPNPPTLYPVSSARREAKILQQIESVVSAGAVLLRPLDRKRRLNGLFAKMQGKWALRPAQRDGSPSPEALFVRVYNPTAQPIRIGIEIRQRLSVGTNEARSVFRRGFELKCGWTEFAIDYHDFRLAPKLPFIISISPEGDEDVRLVFAWLDLVQWESGGAERKSAPKIERPAAQVKCVVWDLDDTLWSGVIGDVGSDAVTIRDWVPEIVRALDERGILQSIVSKNEHDIAWKKMEQAGLADYFLFPTINWMPKSANLREIAANLNIGVDSLAFIDDSAFERAEVAAALPEVRVYDPAACRSLLDLPEFDVPVTEFSAKRRLSYLDESRRRTAAGAWGDDYLGFLRSCRMRLRVGRPAGAEITRCLELLQRTNQFNLSGRRYDEASFERLLHDPGVEPLLFEVWDRFGHYGIVGFAAFRIDAANPVLSEFVMSCRVAQKLVDDTFFKWYMAKWRALGATHLDAKLVVTDRNKPLREQMAALGFEKIRDAEFHVLLRRDVTGDLAPKGVVEVVDESEPMFADAGS